MQPSSRQESGPESARSDSVAIELKGLRKVYDGTTAIEDLSLTVPVGTVFGFLGPNGAGKSTTIDVVMDYVRPTAGSATVLGRDAQTETQAVRRRVGVLPDDYGLYKRLTARQHLAFAIDLKGASTDPDQVLDRVGLDREAADRPVGGYSTGMAQRLSLAIALVGDPDLLILDEPSAGLDPNGVRLVRDIVRDHAASGKTVFFSSHILSQVEAVCDRVAILDQGRLVAVDTIDGLRDGFDPGGTVDLTLGTLPATLTVADLPGVSSATVTENHLRVQVTRPEAKVAVIDRVREDGGTILDVSIQAPSLDDLFSAYTGHGPDTRAEAETRQGGPLMSVTIVARKEFQDAVRSRTLWGIVVVIAVMTSLSASIAVFVPAAEAGPEMAIGGASQFAGLLVPIVALVAASVSIAGERESGSLKVLLGLPVSRGTVVLGKFLGRSLVVSVGLVIGFGASGLVIQLVFDRFPLATFLGTLGLTVLLGVVFVGIAVGISAISRTRSRAMTLAVGAYLGLTLLWDLLPNVVHLLVTGQMPGEIVPAWFLFLQGLSPTGAYAALVRWILIGGEPALGTVASGPGSVLLQPSVNVLVLALWTLVPIAGGFLSFRRADLS